MQPTTTKHFLLVTAAALLLFSSCEELIAYVPRDPVEKSEVVQPDRVSWHCLS